MSRAPGKLVLHRRSSGVAIATLDAFFLMRCFGDVSPDDIKATLDTVEPLLSYRPEGTVSIVVVDPSSAFPSEATRRAAVEVTRKTNAKTTAQFVVVLGDGFWAGAIRGILTTLASLSHSTHLRKVMRYEEDAVDAAIEIISESAPKYRSLLLTSLEQLKPVEATSPPPASNATASAKSPPMGSKAPPSSKRRAG